MSQDMQFNFNAAKSEVRKQLKVKVRMNVYSCCRGCVDETKLGMKTPEQPILWHFGGQGNTFTWVNGVPYYRDYANRRYYLNEDDMMNVLYFNHDNLSIEQKREIVGVFEKWGFVVEYDYTEYQCIMINFRATKVKNDAVLAESVINSDMAVMV